MSTNKDFKVKNGLNAAGALLTRSAAITTSSITTVQLASGTSINGIYYVMVQGANIEHRMILSVSASQYGYATVSVLSEYKYSGTSVIGNPRVVGDVAGSGRFLVVDTTTTAALSITCGATGDAPALSLSLTPGGSTVISSYISTYNDGGGNLGIAVVPSAWGSNWRGLQTRKTSLFDNDTRSYLAGNAYYDGTNWRAIATAPSVLQTIDYAGGSWTLQSGPSTTAGSIISYTSNVVSVDASSNLTVSGTATVNAAIQIVKANAPGDWTSCTIAGDGIVKGSAMSQPVVLAVHNGSAIRADATSIQFRAANASTDTMSLSSTGLTINGGLGTTLGIVASGSVTARGTGSNTVGAGPNITANTAAQFKGYILQQNGSNGLDIWTGNAAANNWVNQVTLDTAGNLGIGVSTGLTSKLTVVGDAAIMLYNSTKVAVSHIDYDTTGANLQIGSYKSTGSNLVFMTNSNGGGEQERARVDSSGNFLVGTATVNGGIGLYTNGGASYQTVAHIAGTSSGTSYLSCFYNGVGIGGITQSGTTAVLYNTTSDQRLKENVTDAASSSSLIDSIKVRQFDWKSDGSHQRYGFVAQELVEVAPEAVSQPADPEAMMAVDYSKLVPMLVKEVQELRSRLAILEAK